MESLTVTGAIGPDQKDKFVARLAQLSKRATKLGLRVPTVTFGEGEWREEKEGRREFVIPVTVTGDDVFLSGWRIVAALDVMDAAKGLAIVRTRSDAPENPEWRKRAGQCDHCGISRTRKMSVVIRHDNGDEKLVGVDCLADYTERHNNNLAQVIAYFEAFIGICDDLTDGEDDESESRGPRPCSYFEPLPLLEMTAELVLNHGGYISSATADRLNRTTTVSDALHNLYGKMQSGHARIIVGDAARELAREALAWAQATSVTSSYIQNIQTIALAGYAMQKHLALLCSIVPAFQNQAAREARQKVARDSSAHVGKVGDKLVLSVELERVIPIESFYGTNPLHIFHDESGNVLKWFCSGARPQFPAHGYFKVAATVKAHGDRNGVKETTLTRVREHAEKAPKASKAKKNDKPDDETAHFRCEM